MRESGGGGADAGRGRGEGGSGGGAPARGRSCFPGSPADARRSQSRRRAGAGTRGCRRRQLPPGRRTSALRALRPPLRAEWRAPRANVSSSPRVWHHTQGCPGATTGARGAGASVWAPGPRPGLSGALSSRQGDLVANSLLLLRPGPRRAPG